jgi:glycosyltransferase involved in cell wall biosynthesis
MKIMKILFIKPDTGKTGKLWAVHHYAKSCSSREDCEVYMLSNAKGLSLVNVHYVGHYPHVARINDAPRIFYIRVRAVISAYRRVRPDIIHVCSHTGDVLCLALGRLMLPRAKVFLDIRTLATTRWKHILFKVFTKVFSPFYDRVFVLNRSIAKEYVMQPEKCSLLPLGYDPKSFAPPTRQEVEGYARKSTLKCVYLGFLDKQRKLENMIQAVVMAIEAGCDIKMSIVGNGNNKDPLMQLIESSGHSSRFLFHNFVTQDQLAKIIHGHHLGISYIPRDKIFEPNPPLKTIEILASGIPVAGSDTSGNRIFITPRYNGYLFGDNPEDLRDLLTNIWNSGIQTEMYRNAEKSARHWDWDYLADEYLIGVYKRSLGLS